MIGITGSSGVLGRLLIKHLDSLNLDWTGFDGDIRKAKEVDRWINDFLPDKIIHLAAKVAVTDVKNDPVTALNVNAGGTLNLLSSASRSVNRPWVFIASTSHVYCPSTRSKLIAENSQLLPFNSYGESKLLAEGVSNYFRTYASIELCIGRIFSYFHESQCLPFLYPTIKSRIKEHDTDKPFNIINGEDVRDFSNGEDIVLKIERLMAHRTLGVVNIGSGVGTRVFDFIQEIVGEDVHIRSEQREAPTSFVADISRYYELTKG